MSKSRKHPSTSWNPLRSGVKPKVAAATVGGFLAALVCGFLQARGVQLDVDLATVLGDLLRFGIEPVNVSVRQAVTLIAASAVGYAWPDESAREILAESPSDLDESTERDAP